MTKWCIVQLPSMIEMRDTGKTREWTIFTTADTTIAQIRISEDKFCDGDLTYLPGSTSGTFKFEAPGNRCGLRVSVSGQSASVSPNALVQMLIMLKRHDRWEPVRF